MRGSLQACSASCAYEAKRALLAQAAALKEVRDDTIGAIVEVVEQMQEYRR
jgi:hypothetical protein